MGAGHVQVAPDSTGKDVDADSVVSTEAGTPTVYRQNVILSDPTTYGAKAAVTNVAPANTAYGLVTRQIRAPLLGSFYFESGILAIAASARGAPSPIGKTPERRRLGGSTTASAPPPKRPRNARRFSREGS